MIVEVAEKVSFLVLELEKRKRSTTVNQSMQKTDTELRQLGKKVEKLTNFIQFNQSRIMGNDRERLIGGLTNIRAAVKSSRLQFQEERRQVTQLQLIGNTVDTAVKDAQTAWSTTFRAEMEPVFQATNLAAKLLPDGAQKWIQTLQEEIKTYFSNPPQNRNEMVSLVGKMEQLRNYTQSGIAKYGPAVSAFLAKVQKEDATLADLNREVLEWIREQKIYKKFKITFNQ